MSPSPPARHREKAQVLDEAALDRALTRIAHEILERNGGAKDLAFVGLRTRGVTLAQRLAGKIAARDIKKVPALRGKTIVNLFYENSTRTRTSFEIAGKWLSADVINFSASGSSAAKGESFLDTAKNIEAMSPDVVVVRHASAGAAEILGRAMRCSIVNAGDGC